MQITQDILEKINHYDTIILHRILTRLEARLV